MSRLLSIPLFLALLMPIEAVETIADWLAQSPQDSLVEFVPWGSQADPQIKSVPGLYTESRVVNVAVNSKSIEVPRTPYNRLFGHIKFSGVPDVEFPLTLVFSDVVFDTNKINGNAKSVPATYKWDTALNLYSSQAPMRRVFATRTAEISSAQKDALIPVFAQNKYSDNASMGFNDYLPSVQSIFLEVRGRSGRILARRWLVETYGIDYYAGYSRGNDRPLIKMDMENFDVVSKLNWRSFYMEKQLPPDWPAYAPIGAIQINMDALQDPRVTDVFLRRLLLMGKTIIGSPETIAALTRRLSITAPVAVLNAGVTELALTDSPLARNLMPGYCSTSDSSAKVFEPLKSEPFLKKRLKSMRHYSAAMLGIALVFLTTVILWGFLRWNGQARLRLWWIVPSTSLGLGVVIWMAVPPSLRAPLVQIIQCEYSFHGWPETFAQAQIVSLDFSYNTKAILAPAGTHEYLETQPNSFDAGFLLPSQTFSKPESTKWVFDTVWGKVLQTQLAFWKNTQLPCEVTDHTLRFNRAFEHAWIWNGEDWQYVRSPAVNETARLPIYPGAPKNNNPPAPAYPGHGEDYPLRCHHSLNELPNRLRIMLSPDWVGQPAFKGQGLFIGMESGQSTDIKMEGNDGGSIQFRRLVIHQFPL